MSSNLRAHEEEIKDITALHVVTLNTFTLEKRIFP